MGNYPVYLKSALNDTTYNLKTRVVCSNYFNNIF